MTRPLGSTPTAPSRGFAATTSRSAGAPRDGTHCLAVQPLGRLPLAIHNTNGVVGARLIAVGAARAGGPPHRSQRALLTHWALALGPNAKTHIGKGMHHTGGRQPSSGKAVHPVPADPRALTAAL